VPLYEYQCKKCRHRFEKIQKFSDRPIKKCPECGGTVERLLHAPAVQFKGSGWYVTDYAGKKDTGSSADGSGEKSDKKETAPGHKEKEKEKDSRTKKPEAKKTKD
jgi:putative FmdB family regulatory protein